MMKRRAVIAGLALGLLCEPRAARAQPARKVYRVEILSSAPTSD